MRQLTVVLLWLPAKLVACRAPSVAAGTNAEKEKDLYLFFFYSSLKFLKLVADEKKGCFSNTCINAQTPWIHPI